MTAPVTVVLRCGYGAEPAVSTMAEFVAKNEGDKAAAKVAAAHAEAKAVRINRRAGITEVDPAEAEAEARADEEAAKAVNEAAAAAIGAVTGALALDGENHLDRASVERFSQILPYGGFYAEFAFQTSSLIVTYFQPLDYSSGKPEPRKLEDSYRYNGRITPATVVTFPGLEVKGGTLSRGTLHFDISSSLNDRARFVATHLADPMFLCRILNKPHQKTKVGVAEFVPEPEEKNGAPSLLGFTEVKEIEEPDEPLFTARAYNETTKEWDITKFPTFVMERMSELPPAGQSFHVCTFAEIQANKRPYTIDDMGNKIYVD